MPLCDTLLRLAAAGFYRPVWSSNLLDELVRSLENRGFPSEAANRRRAAMALVFPEALNDDGASFTATVPVTVDAKDRHVVATAIASKADAILTANLKDFPSEEIDRLGIQVISPDDLLVGFWEAGRYEVLELLVEQAAALKNPPVSLADLLAKLENSAPRFVAKVIVEAVESP